MKKIILMLICLIFLIGIASAEEGCFIKFTFNESFSDIVLSGVENLYGNYQGFVPVSEGVYNFKFYDDRGIINEYQTESSLIIFYDDFENPDNPGGSDFLDTGILEIIIPYENYSKLEVFFNQKSRNFDLSNYNFACKRSCGLENEAISIENQEKCCENLYPLYNNGNYVCRNSKDYLDYNIKLLFSIKAFQPGLNIELDEKEIRIATNEAYLIKPIIYCKNNCNNVQAELIREQVQLSPDERSLFEQIADWFKNLFGITGNVILDEEIKDCQSMNNDICTVSWQVSENNPGTYTYYVKATSSEQDINSDLINLVVLSPEAGEETPIPSSGSSGTSGGGGSSGTSTQQNQTETETFVEKGTNMSQEEKKEYVEKEMGVTIYVIAGLVIILISILVVLFIKSRKK